MCCLIGMSSFIIDPYCNFIFDLDKATLVLLLIRMRMHMDFSYSDCQQRICRYVCLCACVCDINHCKCTDPWRR